MAEKKINGRTFKTEPMLAMESLVLQGRLFKAVGPAIGKLGDVLKGRGPDASDEAKEASNSAAISAFGSLFANSDPKQLAELVRDIIEVAMIKGDSGEYRQCDFDGDFTGKQKDIVPVVMWVLGEQYGDFFAGLPGIGNLKRLATA